MTDAYVIHSGEQTAGIVVREQNGFHFFASLPGLFALEGRLFSGLGELHRAIDAIQRETQLRPLRRPWSHSRHRFHQSGRRAA